MPSKSGLRRADSQWSNPVFARKRHSYASRLWLEERLQPSFPEVQAPGDLVAMGGRCSLRLRRRNCIRWRVTGLNRRRGLGFAGLAARPGRSKTRIDRGPVKTSQTTSIHPQGNFARRCGHAWSRTDSKWTDESDADRLRSMITRQSFHPSRQSLPPQIR